MAVTASNTRTTAQFEYKADFDTEGVYNLPDYTRTVGYVKESATNQQIYDGVRAIFSITAYHAAPYIINRTDKSELVTE